MIIKLTKSSLNNTNEIVNATSNAKEDIMELIIAQVNEIKTIIIGSALTIVIIYMIIEYLKIKYTYKTQDIEIAKEKEAFPEQKTIDVDAY